MPMANLACDGTIATVDTPSRRSFILQYKKGSNSNYNTIVQEIVTVSTAGQFADRDIRVGD